MDIISRHEEYQYLDLLKKVSEEGVLKSNRTGIKTKSIFGNTMRFTLMNDDKKILPLLTTKNMLKSSEIIFKELDFFIHGKTNNKILQEQDVKIWNANTSREFLDSIGLYNYEEGDMGAIYGFQWRHYNANYINCNSDYTNQGIDQLQNAIDLIKKDPFSRRIIVSAWNPEQNHKMVLCPCHTMFQFNVEPSEYSEKPHYLSCMLYQRSADLPLGTPFNIASYAALTHIIADLTGLKAKEFIYTTADSHIYENQLSLIKEQIERTPYPFPEFELKYKEKPVNINDYNYEMMSIKNYKYHPLIKYPFST